MSMEPVAWVRESDLKEMQESNIGIEMDVFSFWSDMFDVDVALVRLSDAEARIAELEEEIGRLEDENSDLRCEPWPEWARAVLKVIRKHSGYDGYDDATEGVDMPLELSEHLSEMDAEAGRWQARAEAAEALLKEAGKALEPFVAIIEEYDPWKEGDDVQGTLVIGSLTDYSLMLGHLRAARAIHDKIGVKDE